VNLPFSPGNTGASRRKPKPARPCRVARVVMNRTKRPSAGFFVALKGPLLAYSVEKLGITMTRKFIGIFRLPGARIADQLCRSESRQAGFSCDFYYPLVYTVRNAAHIANKIAGVFKIEFFNRIGQKRKFVSYKIHDPLHE
jgi:hypothetical protein